MSGALMAFRTLLGYGHGSRRDLKHYSYAIGNHEKHAQGRASNNVGLDLIPPDKPMRQAFPRVRKERFCLLHPRTGLNSTRLPTRT